MNRDLGVLEGGPHPWRACFAPHLMVMRIINLIIAVLLGALVTSPAYADGEGPPTFEDRPQVGQPVRFTDATGHVFRPDRLVILAPDGAHAAKLPASTYRARSEERIDLSALPLIGHVFRDRVAPGDAKRRGVFAGLLSRVGDTLVLDAREARIDPRPREIILTANFPRHGTVSYRLGGLSFATAAPPTGTGRSAGTAWMIDGTLVLAGPGYGPGIEDLEGIIGDLFR